MIINEMKTTCTTTNLKVLIIEKYNSWEGFLGELRVQFVGQKLHF